MFKTLEVFFISPKKDHYLVDISKKIGLAHTSVKKNLDKLVKLGLITKKIEKKGKRKFPLYTANFDSNIFRRYKMLYNLTSLLESGLIEFLEDRLAPKSIVVFGSYSRGEDIEESDIDIFIEAKGEEMDLKLFEKVLHRNIQLHFKEDFTSYPKELKNNIINGFVIHGFLEAYK